MTDGKSQWRPGRREQALEWFLTLILRFGVGGGGIIWCVVIDPKHLLPALPLFVGIATGKEVLQARKAIKARGEQDDDSGSK